MKTAYRVVVRYTFTIFSAFAISCAAVIAQAAPGGAGGGGAVGHVQCSINDPGAITVNSPVEFTATAEGGKAPLTLEWTATNATPAGTTDPVFNTTFDALGPQTVTLHVSDDRKNPKTCDTSLQVTVDAAPVPGGIPTSRGDTYGTALGKELVVKRSRISGVLYNDFDTDDITGEPSGNAGLTAVLDSDPSHASSFNLNPDGSFNYTDDGSLPQNSNDSFTYHAVDGDGNTSEVATVNIHIESDQPDFKILMNYELGMHCTGFEFSYCCVLPPYNSIVAQVVKPQANYQVSGQFPGSGADYPRLLEGDPINGLDGLGRERVLRDYDSEGNIHKYFVEYFHDAQPRNEGNTSATQTSTLISAVEGNSLLYWNTPYDSAKVDTDGSITGVPGKLVTGFYSGLNNVVLGDGSYATPCATEGFPVGCTDNFANGWLNHFYIYQDLEGTVPGQVNNRCTLDATIMCETDADCDDEPGDSFYGVCDTGTYTSLERNKIRLGVAGHVEYPADSGAALQPMGPTGNGVFDNDLTFSGDTGTVVYTQMKVLENLPIMLTAPRIWEALGLPLTPFEDTINFFGDPGLIDEDSIRPFVAMKARLMYADCDQTSGGPDGDPATPDCAKGGAVIGSNGKPVIGFGTAPIDIPNCERCHSAPANNDDGTPNVNSPAYVRRQGGPKPFYGPAGETLEALVDLEVQYWTAYYFLDTEAGDTDWYARLKGAAVSIEFMHDYDVGTNFMANYPVADGDDLLGLPDYKKMTPEGYPYGPYLTQNTRMGHESVICQKCHADNVIAVVKSAGIGGFVVPPISEAIHNSHAKQAADGPIVFDDSYGRFGGCQGCHPAHRSDGVTDGYPITRNGDNYNANGDNRLGAGGCFVGRDVHSNPLKDVDGAETPEHLNAVGQWLADNVSRDQGPNHDEQRGIWCTNCHSQLSQEIWRHEDCDDLVNSNNGGECLNNIRAGSLQDIADQVAGGNLDQVLAWLDPNSINLHNLEVTEDFTHAIWNKTNGDIPDANVATIEIGAGGPVVTFDADGDPSVNILSFCTTDDCVAKINANKSDQSQWRFPEDGAVDGVSGFIDDEANFALPVPFSAADDARDHWLAPGEPHCADCHAAPYVEQSGNITAFPPFNYPAKASLSRYTRGHQDISCQGCHESIHGLYPVAPAIDNTSYAQAAALNADGSHGPLKCGACHSVNGDDIPAWISDGQLGGGAITPADFDDAVGWAHTYTAEANVLNTTCQNCHGVNGEFGNGTVDTNSLPADWTKVASHEAGFLRHSMEGWTSRQMMDKAELLVNHAVTEPADGLCIACHEANADHTPVLAAEGCDLDNEPDWMQHLTQGRVAESVWEDVSLDETGTRCGW